MVTAGSNSIRGGLSLSVLDEALEEREARRGRSPTAERRGPEPNDLLLCEHPSGETRNEVATRNMAP